MQFAGGLELLRAKEEGDLALGTGAKYVLVQVPFVI